MGIHVEAGTARIMKHDAREPRRVMPSDEHNAMSTIDPRTRVGHVHLTVSDLDRALTGADAVIALRLQKERQHSGLLPSIREYARTWGLTDERVARMRPDAPVLHPGPMNEGVEIAASVAHGARSLIESQVTNGVAVRMALLYLLAATPEAREPTAVDGSRTA